MNLCSKFFSSRKERVLLSYQRFVFPPPNRLRQTSVSSRLKSTKAPVRCFWPAAGAIRSPRLLLISGTLRWTSFIARRMYCPKMHRALQEERHSLPIFKRDPAYCPDKSPPAQSADIPVSSYNRAGIPGSGRFPDCGLRS